MKKRIGQPHDRKKHPSGKFNTDINVCGVDTVCPPTPQSPPPLGSTGGRGNSTFTYVPQGFMGIVYVFPFRKMSAQGV